MLLGLLVVASLGLACAAAATDPAAPANKRPWFCRGRDCPDFKTVGAGPLGAALAVAAPPGAAALAACAQGASAPPLPLQLDEEDGYTRRCYEKSNWAVSCAWDATMPEGILRARANVLAYIKGAGARGGGPAVPACQPADPCPGLSSNHLCRCRKRPVGRHAVCQPGAPVFRQPGCLERLLHLGSSRCAGRWQRLSRRPGGRRPRAGGLRAQDRVLRLLPAQQVPGRLARAHRGGPAVPPWQLQQGGPMHQAGAWGYDLIRKRAPLCRWTGARPGPAATATCESSAHPGLKPLPAPALPASPRLPGWGQPAA